MVRQQSNAPQVEIAQNLRADADFALDRTLMIGGGSLRTAQRLRQLAMKGERLVLADALDRKTLPGVVKIDERAAALCDNAFEREVQRLFALARARAEDVAGQAMRVHANQHRIGRGNFAAQQRDVRRTINVALVRDHAKLAVTRAEQRFAGAMNGLLVLQAVANEFGDGQQLQVVPA